MTTTDDTELTAQEARDLAARLALDLYRAQDALEFVAECCTIAERGQKPVTTADVREWLKGARCARQFAADTEADVTRVVPRYASEINAADESADMVREAGALRGQIATAVRSVLYRDLPGDMGEHVADAVLLAVLPHGQFLGGQLRHSEGVIERVIGLHARWVKAGPPPPGTWTARWWDTRLVELHDAIVPSASQRQEQQEQAAPVDWQAIAKQRERELKAIGEARHAAEQERDTAYRERAHLVALLAALTDGAVITYAPDIEEPGWQIVYLLLRDRQASWHISPRDADLFAHVERVEYHDPRGHWDGHTTDEKYEGIREWTAVLAQRCGPACAEQHTEAGRCEIARNR